MNTIKVFECFSGYGSQSLALKHLNIPYEVVAISEIDKYAVQGYEALHGKANNLGDISKINVEDIPDHDLFTYSFPCQDISIAGRGLSLEEGSGTRSSLLWECKKVIEHCKPKYLLLENVKNLVSKKHKDHFDKWLFYLEGLGYTNYWKVLNAKNYGIPQNRERVFVVSVLGEHGSFEFADEIPLTKCISDILDDEVDEKFYMNKPFKLVNKGHQAELDIKGHDCIKRVYSTDNIAPTLTTMSGGNTEPKILIDDDIKPSVKVNFEREKDLISTSDKEIHQCKCNGGWQDNKVGIKVSPTLRAGNPHTCVYNNYRIRKLTPSECLRLMGLRENEVEALKRSGLSNSRLYKLAGNSIVVDVLEHIFSQLFKDYMTC